MRSRLHLNLVQAETNQLTTVTVSTEDGAVKQSHAAISVSSITNDRATGGGVILIPNVAPILLIMTIQSIWPKINGKK